MCCFVNDFHCMGQISSEEVVVRRVNEKLTVVPQNITRHVTKLDLQDKHISVLYDTSFHLFEKINSIKLRYNPI